MSFAGVPSGTVTPRAQPSLRPITLKRGSFEYQFHTPNDIHFNASELKDRFLSTLPASSEDIASDDEPSSVPELVARFLGFIAEKIDLEDHPEPLEAVLMVILCDFERSFMSGNEVHSLASRISGNPHKQRILIRSYYLARAAADRPIRPHESALFREAADQKASLYAIFGGQGNTEDYMQELQEAFTTYTPFVENFVEKAASHLMLLSRDAQVVKLYPSGLDVMRWLHNPDSKPDRDYLISAPVSFPLIGLIQLVHYVIACKVMGYHPGQFQAQLKGTTGHSQGMVVAAAIAGSTDWNSFDRLSMQALTILFYIGSMSQQSYPRTSINPSYVKDSIAHGEGTPTPMLSIRDLPQSSLQSHIDITNEHLPPVNHVSISLINSARNFVATGPPISLYGLNLRLRKVKTPPGLDQTRIPYTERKIRFVNAFLPITAPFHSRLLAEAQKSILGGLKDTKIPRSCLKIPVFETSTGKDIRTLGSPDDDIVPELVRLITLDPVNWEKATVFPGVTHILDFGPGGMSGIGVLTNRNKDGTGVRVILAGTLGGANNEVGYKPELFDRDYDLAVQYAPDWMKEHGPTLVRNSVGKIYVDTKMSRLLGLPPIMVAGMTPCTVSWKFVSATMNAGYEIELAGGGYFTECMMSEAISKIADSIPAGRGISVNFIYVNPTALQWQIPMIRKLRNEGVPIEGLTIGAGVPSIEVANEYIATLGLKRIAFKPGSLDAIQQVVNIAKENPNFPVALQWTGGRGGGHHSYEDFHQPILTMYSRIRKCSNIILIAGSGFGGAEDTYPYLTGSWSTKHEYPPMPFDGILFGSRMMVAKEAPTSHDVKKAICAAEGLDDSEWEKTYKGPAGGVITVRSEMGEPIHKLATRGVLFWAEMDRKIFSLERSKQLVELQRMKGYIIEKLNKDFQKVWFGKDSEGKPVDLEDMSYFQVVQRLVELLFVKHEKRWIDKSLKNMTGDFIRRVEERLSEQPDKTSIVQNFSVLDDPFPVLETLRREYPLAEQQTMNSQDVQFFLMLSTRRGQKPVPFVPVLDENFEHYFKKDSLWQSEDLEAVVDRDVQRTCILHGPVAAKFSKVIDEPVKEILDGIHSSHINYLIRDQFDGDASKIPTIAYIGGKFGDKKVHDDAESVVVGNEPGLTTYRIPDVPSLALPETDSWLSLLGGKEYGWRHAFFTTDVIIQGKSHVPNSIKRVFAPAKGLLVKVFDPEVPEKTKIIVYDSVASQNKGIPVIEVGIEGNVITLNLIEYRNYEKTSVKLPLKYAYRPEDGYAPIHEIMEGRNDRIKEFYHRIWFGSGPVPFDVDITQNFEGDSMVVSGEAINEFLHATGNTGEAYVDRPGKEVYVPMDYAIKAGWKALIQPFFPRSVDCDLLKLLHLGNRFKMREGAECLKKGDVLSSSAKITALINQDSGKMMEVCGTILKNGKPAIEITTQFLYRGSYTDYENTFHRKHETLMELYLDSSKSVSLLMSKEWFELERDDIDLLHVTLFFRLQSMVRFKNKTVFSSVRTFGEVQMELSTKEIIRVAWVDYEYGECRGNPVMEYLSRNGKPLDQPVFFENGIPLHGKVPLRLKAPASNEAYARVSGDFNPIHVNRLFSNYVNLPGTITHGMYTSAAVRSLVETWAAENHIGRMRSYNVRFLGLILPDDQIDVKLMHVGMVLGRKIIRIEASNPETDEKVLDGEAEVEQPVSAFVFTGQGSQEQGMGMDLYESSPVARSVWDRADKHLMSNYGFSIIDIVKRNPKKLTIHFGGPRGKAMRQNYMAMTFETVTSDGSLKSERIFKNVDENSTSYTYYSPAGLLSATQFTQPSLTLMENASYEDMRAKGLVQKNSIFSGHSLGEFSAVAALAGVMPIESLVSVVFYRGLTMQVAVERDEQGRSNYGMCAVDPSRVGKGFNEQVLRYLVKRIAEQTGLLVEIVNYNILNTQYVAAGDLGALDCLTNVLNYLKIKDIDVKEMMERVSLNIVKEQLREITDMCYKQTLAKPRPIELKRGYATAPLKGIDVPFHSTFLRSGVKVFRNFLLKKIFQATIDPNKLIGKYIPNVTGRPFELTKEYFDLVYRLTGSPRILNILTNWDEITSANQSPERLVESAAT